MQIRRISRENEDGTTNNMMINGASLAKKTKSTLEKKVRVADIELEIARILLEAMVPEFATRDSASVRPGDSRIKHKKAYQILNDH
jgi:hypothetical protein